MSDQGQSQMPEERLDVKALFGGTWRLCRENLFLFLAIFAVGQILFYVLSMIERFTSGHASLLVTPALSVLQFLVGLWAGAALVVAVSCRHQGLEITLKGSFAGVKGRYWTYVAVTVLCGLIFVAGFLLLVVPGVYWFTILCLAPRVALLEKRSTFDSLRRSRELVRGHFWRVLLVGVIFAAVWLAVLSMSFWGFRASGPLARILVLPFSVVIGVFSAAFYTSLYFRLSEIKERGEQPSRAEGDGEKGKGCLTCASMAGLLVGIAILVNIGARVLDKSGVWEVRRLALPGGVELARPAEWSARRVSKAPPAYRLSNNKMHFVRSALIWSLSLEDLENVGPPLSLAEEALAAEMEDAYIERFRRILRLRRQFDPQSLAAITLATRSWAQYSLLSEEEGRRRVRTHIYTAFGGNLILLTYQYTPPPQASESEIESLRGEEEKLLEIAAALSFPSVVR